MEASVAQAKAYMFRRGGLSPAAFVGKASSGTAAASSACAMVSPPPQGVGWLFAELCDLWVRCKSCGMLFKDFSSRRFRAIDLVIRSSSTFCINNKYSFYQAHVDRIEQDQIISSSSDEMRYRFLPVITC